jgi:hypothetical protein
MAMLGHTAPSIEVLESNNRRRIMKRLARILVGYRDDLHLASRWWHRLFKVLGTIGLIALGGLTVPVLNSARQEPAVSNVRILENLEEFTKKAKSEVSNTIPTFLELPGELGGIKDGKVIYISDDLLRKDFCSATWLPMLLKSLKSSTHLKWTRASISRQSCCLNTWPKKKRPEHMARTSVTA